MARNERHVVPNPEGGWDVTKPDAERRALTTTPSATPKLARSRSSGMRAAERP